MVDGAGTEIPRGMLRRRARFLVRGGCYATALSAPLLTPQPFSSDLNRFLARSRRAAAGPAGAITACDQSRFQFTRRGVCMSRYQSVTRPLGWGVGAGLLALLAAGRGGRGEGTG